MPQWKRFFVALAVCAATAPFVQKLTMRINRFLASAGLGSRRAVEELILEGRVTINGRPVTTLATQVQPGDAVKVGRRLIESNQGFTVVMNKPAGCVCSASDEQGRQTVFDLLPPDWPRLFHVGRLDKDSEGLLILTNDGDLANELMHPRYKVEKEYEVTLDRPWDPKLAPKLLKGVHVEGGRASAVHVGHEGPSFLRLVLTQGINRQIHKMLWRVGNYNVKRLKRVRIGKISITGLGVGQFRVLPQKDVAALHSTVEAAAHRGEKKQKIRTERAAKRSPRGAEERAPRKRAPQREL
jgi:23S rRNA pseudouridine2605 synthase